MTPKKSGSHIELRGGNWRAGWALDYHTVSSAYTDGGSLETERSEVGELLYQLKYREDRSKIEPLAERASEFLETRLVLPHLAAIIPVPPSVERDFQPVLELAVAIGRKLGLPVPADYLIKVKRTTSLKNLDGKRDRKKELIGVFRIEDNRFAGKCALVFDDIFRSGETLREIIGTLIEQGGVARVFVLTLTRTRKKK